MLPNLAYVRQYSMPGAYCRTQTVLHFFPQTGNHQDSWCWQNTDTTNLVIIWNQLSEFFHRHNQNNHCGHYKQIYSAPSTRSVEYCCLKCIYQYISYQYDLKWQGYRRLQIHWLCGLKFNTSISLLSGLKVYRTMRWSYCVYQDKQSEHKKLVMCWSINKNTYCYFLIFCKMCVPRGTQVSGHHPAPRTRSVCMTSYSHRHFYIATGNVVPLVKTWNSACFFLSPSQTTSYIIGAYWVNASGKIPDNIQPTTNHFIVVCLLHNCMNHREIFLFFFLFFFF